jgi:hypothetical protein
MYTNFVGLMSIYLVNWLRENLMICYCQLYPPGSIQHLPTNIERIELTQTCHVKRAGEAIVCLHALFGC